MVCVFIICIPEHLSSCIGGVFYTNVTYASCVDSIPPLPSLHVSLGQHKTIIGGCMLREFGAKFMEGLIVIATLYCTSCVSSGKLTPVVIPVFCETIY